MTPNPLAVAAEELRATADKLRAVASPLSSPLRSEVYWNGWHNGLAAAADMLEKRAVRLLRKPAKSRSKKR